MKKNEYIAGTGNAPFGNLATDEQAKKSLPPDTHLPGKKEHAKAWVIGIFLFMLSVCAAAIAVCYLT